MNSETIIYCIFAVILGMLLFHMLKNICGCKVVEGACQYYRDCLSINDRINDICCVIDDNECNQGCEGTCQNNENVERSTNDKFQPLICQRNSTSSSVQNTDQGH